MTRSAAVTPGFLVVLALKVMLSLRCTMLRFDMRIYCKVNTTVTKVRSHTHHLTQLQVLCVGRTFKIHFPSILSNTWYNGVQHRILLPLFQQALSATFSPAGPEERPINRVWSEGAEAFKEMPALASRSPGTRLPKMYSGRNVLIPTKIETGIIALLHSDFGGSNHANCVL